MEQESRTIRREELRAHDAWLLRLARAVARDDLCAEDLAQDAWLVALQSPPPRGPLRAWLAGVLRNLARAHRRAGRRDGGDPAALASPAPTGLDAAELRDLQAAVRAAVAELPEPFRATVEQRFHEGLSWKQIATRQQVPVATARSRVRLGLERLRRRLGPHQRALLLVLARRPGAPAPAPPAAATTAAGSALPWGLTALGALAGLLLLTRVEAARPPAGAPDTRALVARSGVASPAGGLATVRGTAAARRPAAAPEGAAEADRGRAPGVDAAAAAPPADPARLATGRVFDPAGVPVRGATVEYRADEPAPSGAPAPSARTDAQGRFELPVGDGTGRLEARAAGWTPVLAARVLADYPASDLTLTVARARALGGRVVDGTGAGLAGARVSVRLARDPRTGQPFDSDLSESPGWSCTSEADGSFRLAEAPELSEAELWVEAAGHLARRVPVDALDPGGALIALEALGPGSGLVAGRVLTAEGEPAPGAWVALGSTTARCDVAGRFQLEPVQAADAAAGARVVAALEGRLPAVGALDPARAAALELVLGGAPLAIEGTVVDAGGAPVPGALVWRCEGTPFGWLSADRGGFERRALVDCELIASGGGDRAKLEADGRGRFRLEGLAPRGYRVAALDPATLALVAATVEAGASGVTLRIEPPAEARSLAGRAVDLEGRPVAGLQVLPARLLGPDLRSPCMVPTVTGRAARTDADGRFALPALARAGLIVCFDGDPRYSRAVFAAPDTEQPEDYPVARQCRLLVEAPPGEEATRFEVLDRNGARLALLHYDAGLQSWGHSEPLRDGASLPVLVPETASTVVLFDGASETRRVPARLAPGRLTVVRP